MHRDLLLCSGTLRARWRARGGRCPSCAVVEEYVCVAGWSAHAPAQRRHCACLRALARACIRIQAGKLMTARSAFLPHSMFGAPKLFVGLAHLAEVALHWVDQYPDHSCSHGSPEIAERQCGHYIRRPARQSCRRHFCPQGHGRDDCERIGTLAFDSFGNRPWQHG